MPHLHKNTPPNRDDFVALFIADLHLDESRPDITAIFLKFLREEAIRANALYILGDLFEIWIGDDHDTTFNQSIIQALRQTREQGTALYLMKGNRDFLLGKKFMKQTGCHLLPDEHLITLGDKRTLLMHGDTLCTEDLTYLKFRKRARNFFVQKLFLWKPLSKRKLLAQQAQKMSHDHKHSLPSEIMDVTQEEVMRIMTHHQVQHLIHGHTHRPAVHQFLLNGKPATRTVLAPWHTQGSALIHQGDRQEFFEIV